MNQVLAWLAIHPQHPRTGFPYLVVRVGMYIIALVLMVLVYGTKQRGLIIAPPIGLLAAAGTWYVLGDTTLDARQRLINALGAGLMLGELTWAFGYWDVAALVGGAGLWLAFYILSRLIEHAASEEVDRRIAVEYAVVTLIGTVFILSIAQPWSV